MGFISFALGVFFSAFMVGIIIDNGATFYFGLVGMAIIVCPFAFYIAYNHFKEVKEKEALR